MNFVVLQFKNMIIVQSELFYLLLHVLLCGYKDNLYQNNLIIFMRMNFVIL